jgi:4-hydroxymandelate oxidase
MGSNPSYDDSGLLNLEDYEAAARAVLPPAALGYFAGGAMDEVTLRANPAAWERLRLRPRVLRDVSQVDTGVTVLGRAMDWPVLVAPMAFHAMAHPEGEAATARAAHRVGCTFTLSTLANTSLEDVRAASDGPLWFQLYVYRDRGLTRSLVERAEAAGYEALVLTVDTPLLGRREADVRHRFTLPLGLRAANLTPSGEDRLPLPLDGSGLAAYILSLFDASLTWRDVEWFRSITRLPVLLKGVLRADDARRAVDSGAAGLIVSNHGGRQLDTAIATADALPEVAEAAGELEVLVDGGIRRGTDVLKALALGARAVMLGRPVLWGLAARGERGAERVLRLLRAEVELAFALAGCASRSDVQRDLIAPHG